MKRLSSVLLLLVLTGVCATGAFAQAPAPAPNGAMTASDYKAQCLLNLQIMGRRFLIMANNIPADKYTWTPGQGGRSVAELLLHAADVNWIRPGQFGAAPPDGFKQEGYENSTTDKATIVDQIGKAFAYSENAVQHLSDADLQRHIKVNGGDTTVAAFLEFWISDTSEYVGQMIVYTRSNGAKVPTPGDVVGHPEPPRN